MNITKLKKKLTGASNNPKMTQQMFKFTVWNELNCYMQNLQDSSFKMKYM